MLPIVNAISRYRKTRYFEMWLSDKERLSNGFKIDKSFRMQLIGQWQCDISSRFNDVSSSKMYSRVFRSSFSGSSSLSDYEIDVFPGFSKTR